MDNFAEIALATEEVVRNHYGAEPVYDRRFNRSFWLWDHYFSYDQDGKPHPCFSVQETAKTFFARGSWWLRDKYRRSDAWPHGPLVLNGILLEPKRLETGSRYYTLADIERMAHAMAENRVISGEKLAQVVTMLLIHSVQHGVFVPKRVYR